MAVSQHMHDIIQLGSTTALAVKDINKIRGISRWMVQGKDINRKQGKGTSRYGSSQGCTEGHGPDTQYGPCSTAGTAISCKRSSYHLKRRCCSDTWRCLRVTPFQ